MPASGEQDVTVHNGGTLGLPARMVRRAVGNVLHREGRAAQISVTFLGKHRMRELNRQYLRHDWPTDVLSFELTQPGNIVAGDVYVCRYEAARNARAHATTVRDELLRLVIHGTLHVLGWEHPDDASRLGSEMWQRQEQYVTSIS